MKRKLKDCCTIIAGQSPESKYYNTDGQGLPFFQGKADFGELYPSIRVYCSQPTKIAEKDDILLSVRAPVGPTNLAPCRVCIGRGLTAIRPSEDLLTRYVLLFFRYFEAQLAAKGTGTTFKAVTQDIVKNLEIPVPSLQEQERLVARTDELFSELDAGVDTLQKIKQQLSVYRQTVLKDAFACFTDKEPISKCSVFVTSGSRGWAKYYADTGARFVRITDLTRYGIELQDKEIQYVLLPENAEGKRSRLVPNDVLISITADLGSIALVPETIGEAYINQHIAMVRFYDPALGKFMAWYLRSDYGQKELLRNKRGNGKMGLGLDDIRQTLVPVIDRVEAHKTVETIEKRLSVCDSIQQTVDQALQQSVAMRQSVLKQAFEGGL